MKLNIDNRPINVITLAKMLEEGKLVFKSWEDSYNPQHIEDVLVGIGNTEVLCKRLKDGTRILLSGGDWLYSVLYFVLRKEAKLENLQLMPELNGMDYETMPVLQYNKLNEVIFNIKTISTGCEEFATITEIKVEQYF